MLLAACCLCAFLLGAVPWALLTVRLCKGVDLRTIGSGNVGATNASRAFASKAGRLVAFLAIYLLDAGKGFVPAWFGPAIAGGDAALAGVLLGASAILGHVFCPFLGWKGGKGVATALGVLLGLNPILGLATLVTWVVVAYAFRYSSLAAMIASVFAPFYYALLFGPDVKLAAVGLMSVLLIYRHRKNIANLLSGKESRIGKKAG